MQTSSRHLRKERCPKCAKVGLDRSGNNLSIYEDGGEHCWACGYHRNGSTLKRYQTKQVKKTHQEVHLPSDITNELPAHAITWIKQYGFTRTDTIKHKLLWSDYHSRLIFPFFDGTGLVAWQGRYLGTAGQSKWFSQGFIHDIVVPINVTNRSTILVESFISAYVVGKVHGAIPLFGSQTNAKHLLRLSKIVDEVRVWLDPDKRSEAVKIASMSNLLGLPATVIFTDKKPHQMEHHEIKILLEENTLG